MRAATVLVVVLLVGAVFLAGLAQGVRTPWPTVDFDRGQLPGLVELGRVLESFGARPVPDRGRAFLLGFSGAALGAPQRDWILLRLAADDEHWTAAEFAHRWSLVLWLWERTLTIHFFPRAPERRDVEAAPLGNLTGFHLETSTGYREAISGDSLPHRLATGPSAPTGYAPAGYYDNAYLLRFDRRAAIAPGTEWIRLYVMTTGARMYFEWRF